MGTNIKNKAAPSVEVPRLVRLLRDSHPSYQQGKIEDEISESLDMASDETIAELLRDPIVCTRRLYDGLLREAVARLLLPNVQGVALAAEGEVTHTGKESES